MEEHIEIYCDGSCKGNPGPGGWGAVLMSEGNIQKICGTEEHTTNNRMEMLAAIKALEAVSKKAKIYIHTDSMYLKNGITSWIHSWKKSDWRKGTIKNVDLWQRLDEISSTMDVEWRWVRGHSGNKWNEMADQLAKGDLSC